MCFELLGLDVMIDTKLKPYLIEVNHSPSFRTDSRIDKLVKHKVIQDSLKILGVQGHSKKDFYDTKQQELVRRTLTGKSSRLSRYEQTEKRTELVAKLDNFQQNHLGGFTPIYTNESEAHYKQFIEEAEHLYNDLIGG